VAASPPPQTLLDLGCGHGLVARELAPHFETVHAIDPSEGMIEQARRLLMSSGPRIHVRQASAEDLAFLPDASVDLVVAGQAAHWFDYRRAWPELARVLRRGGGSLAFWGYKDPVLVGYPATSAVYDRFCYGEGEVRPGLEGMARFWEYPGRGILRDSFRAVEPPAAEWEDIRRLVWDPDRARADLRGAPPPPEEALWMRKDGLTLAELAGFLRTYSAFNNWKAAHPERKGAEEGGDGDLVDFMMQDMVDAVPEWKARGDGQWRDIEVDAVWGTALLMARRRP